GPVPLDPTKVLSSRKMQHLMAALSSHFDLVIYDTPPLLGLADANLLAAHTNGLMLVVGLHQTEREALLLAFEDLKMAGIPLLGMVANNDKGSRYYYQSYVQDYV
ncbi:lipopolysaccharide biosynthesis protein, partial [Microcoleus sp. HI-ES]|nr:lipopolysaccharide biosynthesis protein [Microcoleus sp. HI-ES]